MIPTPLVLRLPIQIVSLANKREHWTQTAKRKKLHREPTRLVVTRWLGDELRALGAWDVSLLRIGRGTLDDDNLAGGFKHVRDGVADALGVDDGDRLRVRWFYGQRTGKPEIEITIEARRAGERGHG